MKRCQQNLVLPVNFALSQVNSQTEMKSLLCKKKTFFSNFKEVNIQEEKGYIEIKSSVSHPITMKLTELLKDAKTTNKKFARNTKSQSQTPTAAFLFTKILNETVELNL